MRSSPLSTKWLHARASAPQVREDPPLPNGGWRREMTGKRPPPLPSVPLAGLGADIGPKFDERDVELAARAMAPDPPNLKATTLARDESQKPLKLEELDVLKPLPDNQSRDRDSEKN